MSARQLRQAVCHVEDCSGSGRQLGKKESQLLVGVANVMMCCLGLQLPRLLSRGKRESPFIGENLVGQDLMV